MAWVGPHVCSRCGAETTVQHAYCRACKTLYMREYRSYAPNAPHPCPGCGREHRRRHAYCSTCLAQARKKYREIEQARA